MFRKTMLLTLLLFLLGTSLIAAQDDEGFTPSLHSLGDQTLALNAGGFLPLFFYFFDSGSEATNLSLGGVGSLRWGAYLANEHMLGMEVAGTFTFSPNGRALFLVPITFRYAYILYAYPFEFPLHFGAGINFSRLDESFNIEPIIKPGVSLYWNMDAEWAFGVNFTYWMNAQLYGGPNPPSSHSAFGNFLEISLSAMYHFQ